MEIKPVDFAKPFMPERLTPLFHTSVYAHLTDAQRLRYNQLHAFYLNEQTIFFESEMACHILQDFVAQKLFDELSQGLRRFIAEEAGHSQMFRELNRACWPAVYGRADFYFVRVARLPLAGLRYWTKQAHRFPFFLWILLIQEERALYYARAFLNDTVGLEHNFTATQRRHLADEVGHIQWDEELLNRVWPRTRHKWRGINARLFAWMMGEYFTAPKRSGLRVVAELVKEFPALKPLWPDLQTQMLQLFQNQEYSFLCYSRTVTPKAFARFDQWPEFHSLNHVLPAYSPPTKT
jgi:hypothetical protein